MTRPTKADLFFVIVLLVLTATIAIMITGAIYHWIQSAPYFVGGGL